MVKKRSWPEITVDILEATLSPSGRMRIMYKSNLNYVRFNKYLSDFINKGFIKIANGSETRILYTITERGKTLLDAIKKTSDLFYS